MTTAVALQTASLTLDGLDLLGTPNATYGYRISALGDNLETGDPEAVIALIQSQLQDGDFERIDRSGNRSATIPLIIDAPNSGAPGDAIAQGQKALDAACDTTNRWVELKWTSPLAGALTSVFEVTTATASKDFDDAAEMLQGCRYVTLTIHARPFVRPTTPVTIAAQAVVGSTTTTIDDGTSTTNWSLLTAQPTNGTNLIPNPSFETNTTGWAAAANMTLVGRSYPGYVGSNYMWGTTSAAGNGYFNSPNVAVTAGTSYIVRAALQGGGTSSSDNDRQVGLLVRFYNGSSVQVGSDNVSPLQWTTNAIPWATFAYSLTAPTGAVSMTVYPFVVAQQNGNSLAVDAVSVIASTWGGGYFDGSSTGTSAVTYAWTGTAHASSSTATFTTRTLAVASGMVKGTLYGSNVAAIRRTGAISMTSLPYMKITGTAAMNGSGAGITLAVADNGTAVSVISSSVNPTTGDFTILLNRPGGFATSVDVTATYSGTYAVDNVTTIAVDAITITDNPYGSAAIQTQTIAVKGSQRTDMSLLLRGQDAAGVTPVGLGNEVLVYTAASGADGRATFGDIRTLSGTAGANSDATAISGGYDNLGAAPGSFTSYSFKASKLLPGNYLVFAQVKVASAVVGDTLSFYATEATQVAINGAANVTTRDPRGTGFKTAPFTAVASGAVWPQINTGTWTMIPLGMLRLPPSDVQDPSAFISVSIARGTAAVSLADLFFCNADVGQASLVNAYTSFAQCSTVRLDAASTTSPQALCWVGNGPGTNLYASGTFDSTTDSWAGAGSTTVARVTSPVHDGAGALQITWATASAGAASASGPNLFTGLTQPVTVGAWVQSASGQPTVQLRADDGSGGSVVTSAASIANGTWQFLSVTYTPPASGICRPQIINGSASTAGNTAVVDTVTIKTTTDLLVADAGRWFGEQHTADNGLLQIATVTPGCTTTRVSGTYYPRFQSDVASTP